VTHAESGRFAYTLTVSDGALDYAERPADDPDARISGPERAFIQVFSEPSSRTELEVSGDEALAESLINVLRDGARRTAAAGV